MRLIRPYIILTSIVIAIISLVAYYDRHSVNAENINRNTYVFFNIEQVIAEDYLEIFSFIWHYPCDGQYKNNFRKQVDEYENVEKKDMIYKIGYDLYSVYFGEEVYNYSDGAENIKYKNLDMITNFIGFKYDCKLTQHSVYHDYQRSWHGSNNDYVRKFYRKDTNGVYRYGVDDRTYNRREPIILSCLKTVQYKYCNSLTPFGMVNIDAKQPYQINYDFALSYEVPGYHNSDLKHKNMWFVRQTAMSYMHQVCLLFYTKFIYITSATF